MIEQDISIALLFFAHYMFIGIVMLLRIPLAMLLPPFTPSRAFIVVRRQGSIPEVLPARIC